MPSSDDILRSLENYDRGLNLDPPSYDTLNNTISPHDTPGSPDVDEDDFGDFDIDNDLFLEPDQNTADVNSRMEEMHFSDLNHRRRIAATPKAHLLFNLAAVKKGYHEFLTKLNQYIVTPLRILVIDPCFKLYCYIAFRFEYQLSRIGNPIIMKRFLYVFVMSLFIYFVYSFTNSEEANGTIGKFTDHEEFIHYAKKCIDLKKFEQDLEYISSMSHQPGTMGNQLISNYIHESFTNNGIKNLGVYEYDTYLNYPTKKTSLYFYDNDDKIEIPLNYNNFNPMSINGTIERVPLYYGNLGREKDYHNLQEKNQDIKFEDIALLLKYEDEAVSEQILRAQERNVKAILFIPNDSFLKGLNKKLKSQPNLQGEYDYLTTNFNQTIQNIPVSLPQYGLGDPLTPGTASDFQSDRNEDDIYRSRMVTKLLTLPVSIDQIRPFYESLLEMDKSVEIDLHVSLESFVKHPTLNILAKIEGKEQNNKAIVIASARDSFNNGASYPNFGTATLLSLAQLYQQLKFKYKWKPLRNIYFISYDATMYNFEGPTEMLEAQMSNVIEEIYTFIDITGLNINSNTLRMEATPLLHDVIKRMDDKFDFRISVKNVKSYGNWSPYMAVGMPVIAIGENDNRLPNFSNLDTWDLMYNKIHMDHNNGDMGFERITRLLLFILELSLDIVDDPIIPFNFSDFKNDLSFKLQDLILMYEHYRKEDSDPGESIDFNVISIALMNWQYVINDWETIIKMWEQIVVTEGGNQEPSLIAMHRWAWNRKLTMIPFRQTRIEGISEERKFYKNIFYGPCLYYERKFDSWTFPGIRDAIRRKDWRAVKEQVDFTAFVLEDTARLFKDEGV